MTTDAGAGELARLRALVRVFVDERDWDQFHTPKNLASALAVEAAELLEHFQWLQHGRIEELGADKLVQVRHEMADVLVYLVRLADKLDVDLMAAVEEKMSSTAPSTRPIRCAATRASTTSTRTCEAGGRFRLLHTPTSATSAFPSPWYARHDCALAAINRPQNVTSLLHAVEHLWSCLLYTSPSPRDRQKSRMPSSA